MKIEATGKNVELAIQNGLLECGMKREQVSVEIIDEGGLFKKAKVVLTWGEKEETKIENGETEEIIEPESDGENLVSNDTAELSQVETEEVQEEKEEKKKRIVDTSRLESVGKEFLLGLVKLVDETADISSNTAENEITFSVTGENLGKLIGFHGDTIQALQTIMSGLKSKGEGAVRIFVDVDGYKQNKNQGLVDLANKVAEQAIKIERNIHLDPMNAYDRRIIHVTLQDREDVTTESTGEGEKRHVVIKPIFKK